MPILVPRSVVVVGGGPAGCVTSICLARAGIAVRLLEKSARAHDKVCGECLSGLGLEVLARLGLADRVWRLGANRLTSARLSPARSAPIDVPLPRASCGVTRLALDELLLTAAVEAGVAVTRSARCESVKPGDRPEVVWRNLVDNLVEKIWPDHVVLADGKGMLTGRRPKPTGDIGIKSHFKNADIPAGAICLYSGAGWYGGLATVEDGLVNAAFSVKADLLKSFHGNVENAFRSLVFECPALAEALKSAECIRPWLAAQLPRFAVSRQWPDHVSMVGNAAAAIEPIGGEGMGAAMKSGEIIADRLIESQTPLSSATNRRLRLIYGPRRLTCRTLAKVFTTASLSYLAMPIARAIPRFCITAAGLIGK